MSKRDEFQPVANEVPFDNTVDPLCNLQSENVEDVIYELCGKIQQSADASLALLLVYYNGNANAGRFLEFFPGIDSDIAPIFVPFPVQITTIVGRTAAVNATCTIGVYSDTTLLYTIVFSAQKVVTYTGNPLATIPANGNLKVKIISGSINRPHLYFIMRGV
jgi:hypothetical protein